VSWVPDADLAGSVAQLQAILNAVSESITVQGPGGALLLANEAAAKMLGFPCVTALLEAEPEEVAAGFEVLDHDGLPLALEHLPGRAALRGDEPPEMLVRWRVPAVGGVRYSLVKASPVRDDAGEVRFAVNVFRDVTDRELALRALRASEARLAFLASASRRLLTTSLEPHRVLEEVAELVVPELADWCVIRELAQDGGMPRVGFGPRALESSELLTRLEAYGDLLPDERAIEELAAGRSVLVPEVTPAMLEEVAKDDDHLALLRRLGLRSVMLVPLRTRGRTIGVLTLAGGSDRPAYGAADLALAEELAGRVAATVDNARSFANEHATAETLARALLPGRLPDIPGLELAARYRAAGDVGGDFYDCFRTGGGTWLFVVGDVCGRGIRAASMTGLTRHTIRAAALHESSPSSVLGDLNRLLLDAACEQASAWQPPEAGTTPSFCTVCLAAVTPSPTGARVVVSAAGHPLPFVVRRDAAVTEVGRAGSLLGVMADLEVSEEPVELGPGDALVLFTDGITERRQDGRLFEERLASTLRGLAGLPAGELARRVEDAAVAFGTEAPADDMAVLAICVPASAAARGPGPPGAQPGPTEG
jgi:PAS domain S-box-containing protein